MRVVINLIFENDICITIFDNFFDNFLFRTHIMFLLSLYIVLVFVLIPHFLCKFMIYFNSFCRKKNMISCESESIFLYLVDKFCWVPNQSFPYDKL